MSDAQTRLNKYLALHLGVSRREADNLIADGRVQVDGTTAILGQHLDGETHKVLVDGVPVAQTTSYVYLALNKPTGYVCSRKQQGDNPTIYSLLPAKYHTLKPVGRLDRDSSGLILLTNDGDFAHRMTHPSFAKHKVYRVRLNRDLEPLHQQMIGDFGVNLEDGQSKLGLTRLSDTNRTEWQVLMSEGRNRQIRRTFAALGYEVKKLHRIQFGNYSLDDIPRGGHKIVDMR